MRSILPWSWSSYEKYQTCPRQYYELKIARNYIEEDTTHTIWGKEVHLALENRARHGTELPETMQRFQHVADRVIQAPGDTYVELKLAMTVDGHPCDFDAPDAWCRGIVDILKINGTKALNGDWKTGKRKPGSLQLDLSSVLVMANFPEVEVSTTLFVWFQEPSKPTSKKIYREQMPTTMQQFSKGINDMIWSAETGVWPEKPSGLCKQWCAVLSCKYNGRRKNDCG